MRAPARTAGGLTLAGAVVGLGFAAASVWSATSATFTASSTNPGNLLSAGSLELIDDGTATAALNATGLRPGATVTRCVNVNDNGTLNAADLRLYSTGYRSPDPTSDADALAPYLTLLIESSVDGSVPDCTGFTPQAVVFSGTAAQLASTAIDFGSGAGSIVTTFPGVNYGYRVTATVQDVPAAEATGLTLGLVWEIRK